MMFNDVDFHCQDELATPYRYLEVDKILVENIFLI